MVDRITRFIGFERVLLIVIVLGILLRVLSVLLDVPRGDGAYYATLGYNLVSYQDFVTLSGSNTYNFSLTYPAYLASFYIILGSSIAVTKVASFVCSLLAILLTYFATKDLFDKRRGLIAAAVISLTSALIAVTGKNYVENIVLVFFIPTAWAMVKGFKDSRYIPIAAFFAGLTYCTKTDVGLLIALGGLGGFLAWRFLYMKWAVFKDRYYWFALVIIIVIILGRAWLVSTGEGSSQSLSRTASMSFDLPVFIFQALLHLVLVLGFFIFWFPEAVRAVRDFRNETTSFVLLLVAAFTLLAILNATGWGEFTARVLSGVSREYITIIYVPAMWLFFRYGIPQQSKERSGILASLRELVQRRIRLLAFLGTLGLAVLFVFLDDWLAILLLFGAFCFVFANPRKRLAILMIGLLFLSANGATAVYRPAYVDAAESINDTLQGGQTIGIDKANGSHYLAIDRIYPYFNRQDIELEVLESGSSPDYIISEIVATYPGYTLTATFEGVSKPSVLSLAKDWILGREIPDSFPERTVYLWSRS